MFSLRPLLLLLRAVLLLAGAERAAAYTAMQLALDNVWLNFSTGTGPDSAAWKPHQTPADCLDDTDGARAPQMGAPGESSIRATVTGPDRIDFMWALETTAPNTLTCSLDEVVRVSCPATSDGRWFYGSVTIPEGVHTIRWRYLQAGGAGSRVLLDHVSNAFDDWPSLTSVPWLQVPMGEPVTHTFTTRLPALSWAVYYFWDSLPPGLTMNAATGQITGVPEQPGLWRPLIRIFSASYALDYRISIEVVEQPPLVSALDCVGLEFTASASDGTSVWQPQPRGSRNNGDCLVAGRPPPEQRTPSFLPGWSSLETNVNGPDALSFWLRVANGRLTVLLDGKEIQSLRARGDLSGWQRIWVSIPGGRHRVTWKYEPFQNRAPTAWLDDVRLRSDGRVFLLHQPEVRLQENGTIIHTVPVGGTANTWTATGLPAGLSLDPGNGAITGTPAKRGIWSTRLEVDGPSGDHDDVLMVIDASIPAADAADLAKSVWNPGREAGAKWFGQNTITHDGADAMRSPPTPPESIRSLTTTIQGPGTLRWWWHVAGASAEDSAALVLDGNAIVATVAGVTPWRQEAVRIPDGIHDISWRWKTDATGDPGTETVVVDQVSIGP